MTERKMENANARAISRLPFSFTVFFDACLYRVREYSLTLVFASTIAYALDVTHAWMIRLNLRR